MANKPFFIAGSVGRFAECYEEKGYLPPLEPDSREAEMQFRMDCIYYEAATMGYGKDPEMIERDRKETRTFKKTYKGMPKENEDKYRGGW